MFTLRLAAAAVALPAVTAACADIFPGACTLEARASVGVRVQDAATGAALASGATLILQEGAFVDSVTVPEGAGLPADWAVTTPNSYERAGTYRVTVRRAGYENWERSGVEVLGGRCHVLTVTLTARLVSTP